MKIPVTVVTAPRTWATQQLATLRGGGYQILNLKDEPAVVLIMGHHNRQSLAVVILMDKDAFLIQHEERVWPE
ncbi:MAG: hypothetical protein WCO52_05760 [bacterium]